MRLKCVWPNLITLLSFLSGLTAVILVFEGVVFGGWIGFIVAGLFDRYDGKLARYLGCDSPFGLVIDTLNDTFVFLGFVALSVMHISVMPFALTFPLMLLYVGFGVARLSRFHKIEDKSYNIGLPVTVAGPTLFGLILIKNLTLYDTRVSGLLDIVFIALITGLMVARFKVRR